MSRDDQRWVWMDLEMTGLDDKTCTIIQIATIVTDADLNEIEALDLVIWQPESVLETMVPFVRNMHTENGLLDRVRASPHAMEDAEAKTLEMVQRHVPFRKGFLAGNTIWQDRRFLIRYMPLLERYLHYRMIDVSTVKILSSTWLGAEGMPPQKKSSHTALEDIRDSIEELRFYRKVCFGQDD